MWEQLKVEVMWWPCYFRGNRGFCDCLHPQNTKPDFRFSFSQSNYVFSLEPNCTLRQSLDSEVYKPFKSICVHRKPRAQSRLHTENKSYDPLKLQKWVPNLLWMRTLYLQPCVCCYNLWLNVCQPSVHQVMCWKWVVGMSYCTFMNRIFPESVKMVSCRILHIYNLPLLLYFHKIIINYNIIITFYPSCHLQTITKPTSMCTVIPILS